MQRGYESSFVVASFPLAGGGVVRAELKNYSYSTGEVYWELLRIVNSAIGVVPKTFRLNRWIHEYKAECIAMLEKVGGGSSCLKPSSRAALGWGEHYANDSFVRQEFTVDTRAAVVIMLYHNLKAHTLSARSRWQGLLIAFLTHLAFDYKGIRRKLMEGLQNFRDSCVDYPEGSLFCEHGLSVQALLPEEDGDLWRCCVAGLLHVMTSMQVCAACEVSMEQFLDWAEASVARRVGGEEVGVDLCTDYLVHKRATKRGRIDEDFKHELTVAKSSRGETQTAQKTIRIAGVETNNFKQKKNEGL
jgi:hypothetical protein